MTCLQASFQLSVRGPMSGVIEARAEPPSRLDQRDLEPVAGQNVGSDAAAGTAPNDTYIESLLSHYLLRLCSLCTKLLPRGLLAVGRKLRGLAVSPQESLVARHRLFIILPLEAEISRTPQ
jgi:hypothetical protein